MNIKKFIYSDSNGKDWGIVSAEQLWANVYAIKYNRPAQRLNEKNWLKLLSQAKNAAVDFGAEMIGTRVRLEYEPDLFRNLFLRLGFQKKAGRIEYQCNISELPNDARTPLSWKSVRGLSWDKTQIADFTKEVITGALDVEPDENPEDFVQDWLMHNEFTFGFDCIDIGFLNDKPVALAVVQINKETGWSRISYMGLVPTSRGMGLGKWVHRHGFTLMKNQGGKLYHGGTHSENLAMRKLFESHGCHKFCEMEEWSFHCSGWSA